MAISIARVSSVLPRQHERQPRLGQLEFSGVRGRLQTQTTLAWRNDELTARITRREPGRNPLQRMTSSDLGAAALVFEASDAGALKFCARHRALAAQTFEAQHVHSLERQRRLKSLLGCGIEMSRGSQRPIPVEREAIALKTEGLSPVSIL